MDTRDAQKCLVEKSIKKRLLGKLKRYETPFLRLLVIEVVMARDRRK
jgi:hypothetical protein